MKHERNADEDAILTRLMAEYAEKEGARLWQEYEEAQAAEDARRMPESTDRKCRRGIEKEFLRQKAEALGKPLRKCAEWAAAAVIVGAWYDGGVSTKEDSEALLAILDETLPEK